MRSPACPAGFRATNATVADRQVAQLARGDSSQRDGLMAVPCHCEGSSRCQQGLRATSLRLQAASALMEKRTCRASRHVQEDGWNLRGRWAKLMVHAGLSSLASVFNLQNACGRASMPLLCVRISFGFPIFDRSEREVAILGSLKQEELLQLFEMLSRKSCCCGFAVPLLLCRLASLLSMSCEAAFGTRHGIWQFPHFCWVKFFLTLHAREVALVGHALSQQ